MRFRIIPLCILIVILAAAAFAQKKPSTYWTVKFENIPGHNILWGTGEEAEVTYNPSLWPSFNVVNAEESTYRLDGVTYKSSEFNLSVMNPDPYAEKNTSDSYRWIRFIGVALASSEGEFIIPERGCFMRGIEGWENAPYPQCKIDFMNAGPYPQQHYQHASVWIRVSRFGFISDMRDGETKGVAGNFWEIPPAAAIAIFSKRDCAEPKYTGIGLALTAFIGNCSTTTMSRSGDSWIIDLHQPVKLHHFGYYQKEFVQGKKTTSYCDMDLSPEGQTFSTQCIKAKMTWTRHQR